MRTQLPYPEAGPELMTVPSMTARVGVPIALAISRPECIEHQRISDHEAKVHSVGLKAEPYSEVHGVSAPFIPRGEGTIDGIDNVNERERVTRPRRGWSVRSGLGVGCFVRFVVK